MIGRIYHVGVTVSDMDKSIKFYRDVLGLKYEGELVMEGPETDLLFAKKDTTVRVAYLNGSDEIIAPPIELIQFIGPHTQQHVPALNKTSISEICFEVTDIDRAYTYLIEHDVECLSTPQPFDFTADGFGKSKALYFKDPDGIILELMQAIN